MTKSTGLAKFQISVIVGGRVEKGLANLVKVVKLSSLHFVLKAKAGHRVASSIPLWIVAETSAVVESVEKRRWKFPVAAEGKTV